MTDRSHARIDRASKRTGISSAMIESVLRSAIESPGRSAREIARDLCTSTASVSKAATGLRDLGLLEPRDLVVAGEPFGGRPREPDDARVLRRVRLAGGRLPAAVAIRIEEDERPASSALYRLEEDGLVVVLRGYHATDLGRALTRSIDRE